jgi:hypothetical protein
MSTPEREKRPLAEAPSPDFTYSANIINVARQLPVRRATSWRLPLLDSRKSDPWWYPEPGECGYPEAAAHLLDCGLTPAPNLPAMRSMWKASPESRRVARIISERWERVA